MIVIYCVMVGAFLFDFDLQRWLVGGLAGEVTMIDAIVRAEEVNEKLVLALHDARFGQSVVIPTQHNSVALAGGMIQRHATDDQIVSLNKNGRFTDEAHLCP
jgi:hypothetical protein